MVASDGPTPGEEAVETVARQPRLRISRELSWGSGRRCERAASRSEGSVGEMPSLSSYRETGVRGSQPMQPTSLLSYFTNHPPPPSLQPPPP